MASQRTNHFPPRVCTLSSSFLYLGIVMVPFSSVMPGLEFEGSAKLIKSVAGVEMSFCSRESAANGMLLLCKLSAEVLGFKNKLIKENRDTKIKPLECIEMLHQTTSEAINSETLTAAITILQSGS